MWFPFAPRRRPAKYSRARSRRNAAPARLVVEAFEDRTVPSFMAPVTSPGQFNVVGDFNNDGRADLGSYDHEADVMSVRLGNGDGTFRDPVLSPGAAVDGEPFMQAADVNADGNLDVLVAGLGHYEELFEWVYDPAIHVLLGNGDGTFRSGPSLDLGGVVSFELGDLNNDGRADLVVASVTLNFNFGFAYSNTLWAFLGQGDGTFAVHDTRDLGSYEPAEGDRDPLLALQDINGDRTLDVIVRDDPYWERLFLGRGDGSFNGPVGVDTGNGDLADVNGDGKADLLTARTAENMVGVSLGNGDGTFQPALAYAVGTSPADLAVGDFNGDGRPDLVTANSGSDDVSLLLGNGDGTFRSAQHFATGAGPSSVAAADFDGDGRLDLIAGNGSSISALLNDSPYVSITDVKVTEGNSGAVSATFTVSLSAASNAPVTVHYSTANGTATAGSDYQSQSGALTFAPGETTKTITVPVTGDRLGESNETFFVNLSTTDAIPIDGQGIGTIVDDEPRITINDVARQEGPRGGQTLFVFTVSLSSAYDAPVTVNFTTANGTAEARQDYQAQSGTLTFAPGETTKTITIVVKGDNKKEANETFFLNLGGAVNAFVLDGQGVGTILDDD
jgi:hypothetical protein